MIDGAPVTGWSALHFSLCPPWPLRIPGAQDVSEPAKSLGPDALLKSKVKQLRHREGYEDGLSTTHKGLAALAFVRADNPIEVLGSCTRLVLEGDAAQQIEVSAPLTHTARGGVLNVMA